LGYATVPESAREVIIEEQERGGNRLPWADWQGFQREVLRKQLELEAKVKGPTFLDRGAIDGIAYFRLHGVEPPQAILEGCSRNDYALVFLLEQLPDYRTDDQRKENAETAQKIAELIEAAYAERGYMIDQSAGGAACRAREVRTREGSEGRLA